MIEPIADHLDLDFDPDAGADDVAASGFRPGSGG
jgi:hypothetical protein